MSQADRYFIQEYRKLTNEGFSDKDFEVRPKWEDGTPAHTIKIFGVVRTYDLEKEFPILTLRTQSFKTAVREILWLFRDKSNNINDLKAHIWDQWADEKGSIGKAYGYQLGKKYVYKDNGTYQFMDQVEHLIYKLKNSPMDRRMIITMWNPSEELEMHLAPCCYETLWDVTDGKLNMTLIQRSGDLVAAAGAGGFNDIEYALLVHMVARECNLKPGTFIHYINNLHIYDRHMDLMPKIIYNISYPAPTLWINPEKTSIKNMTEDDFKLIDYKSTKLEEKIEIAV